MSGHNIEREIEGRRFIVEFRRGYDDWEERYYRTAEVYELSDGGKGSSRSQPSTKMSTPPTTAPTA